MSFFGDDFFGVELAGVELSGDDFFGGEVSYYRFLGSSICNLTLTYDFTSMEWTMRDDLPLGDNQTNFITSHIASSAIFHTKNESR